MSDPITETTDPLTKVEDARHFDKLYALRMEGLFHPNPDGSPSARGEVVFYTEIWHFRDNVVFAKSPGPVFRHHFDTLMEREWPMPGGATISTPEILMALESVFRGLAVAMPPPPTDVPAPPMPVPQPPPPPPPLDQPPETE